MQNKELSHLKKKKKKKDIKVDYAQLPAGPASGQSPKYLSPSICEIITPKNSPP